MTFMQGEGYPLVTMLEPGRTSPAKTLELFFDYTCPFAYLASTQAPALASRMGVGLTYRPILLGGVFKAVGTAQNLSDTLGPAKAAHNLADMQRWAKRFGAPLEMPPAHPMRSVDALRATLACGIDPRVIDAFYVAYWRDHRNIADPSVIADVLRLAGHDPTPVMETASTQAVKSELRARTDEAIERGVFGVPTFVVDGQHLYWGQDRMDFVEGWPAEAANWPTEVASRGASGATEVASRGASGATEVASRGGSGATEVASRGATLDFYWDFASPFAYLAAVRVARLEARTGANVAWRPLLLGGLFRALGTPDVPIATFSPAKQRYVGKDLERWAQRLEIPYRWPSRFPMRSLTALRVWLALPETHRRRFCLDVFRAAWGEDRDIEDVSVLASCVGDAAVAREAIAQASSDGVKATLRRATEDARAHGVFGVPTFVVGDELYWGQDRIGLVEEALFFTSG